MTKRPRPYRHWTPEEEALMRQHYPTMRTDELARLIGNGVTVFQVYRKAQQMQMSKAAEFLVTTASGRLYRGGTHGQATQFKPGHVTWNKGTKGVSGHHPNTQATQFKKGQPGRGAKPIGSFRIVPMGSAGTLEMKFSNAPGGPHMRWRFYGRIVWERAHGPIAPGHIVVFKPGMHTTVPEEVTLDRLACITRAENMARNTIHRLPPELFELAHLRGRLNRAIHSHEQGQQAHEGENQ